ncbi:MAG: hypothetical protein R3F56_24500 [Planctomycetota bacterium]
MCKHRGGLAAFTSLALFVSMANAQNPTSTWENGDVFTATGGSTTGGTFKVWTNAGVFKEEVTDGTGFTTGGAFDSNGDLYLTYFSENSVKKFDEDHPHALLQTIPSPSANSHPESVSFDASGNFYVGNADGDRAIRKYDAAGTLLDTYNVTVGNPRGTDWVDLLADQSTVVYTSESRIVYRYDLSTRTQLANFATLPGSGFAYALRTLPPFDLSNGVLVADTSNIKRLDGLGAVAQTYDVANENNWFSINLDPNGTSFWAGDLTSGRFYRFNIDTGAVEVGPVQSTTSGQQLAGIVVRGEITGGNTPPDCSAPTIVNGLNNVPIQFTVTGTDVNVGDIVTLSVVGSLPAGATMTPPLPQTGNPVSSQFDWTPTFAQIGTHDIVFRVRDRGGLERDCPVRIIVRSECLLLFSAGQGQFELGNRDYLLLDPSLLFYIAPVVEASVPVVPIPNWQQLQGIDVYAQVVMFNDFVFPNDPVKVSNGMRITLGGGLGNSYGQGTGLVLRLTEPSILGGNIRCAFQLVP